MSKMVTGIVLTAFFSFLGIAATTIANTLIK